MIQIEHRKGYPITFMRDQSYVSAFVSPSALRQLRDCINRILRAKGKR